MTRDQRPIPVGTIWRATQSSHRGMSSRVLSDNGRNVKYEVVVCRHGGRLRGKRYTINRAAFLRDWRPR